jgi:hypothetical protein
MAGVVRSPRVGRKPVGGAHHVGSNYERPTNRLQDDPAAPGAAGILEPAHSERYSMVWRWPVSCERTIASQISAQR